MESIYFIVACIAGVLGMIHSYESLWSKQKILYPRYFLKNSVKILSAADGTLESRTNFVLKKAQGNNHKRKKGWGAMVGQEIKSCFENKTEKAEIYSALKLFLAERAGDLKRVHMNSILLNCAKRDIDITKLMPLDIIEKILINDRTPVKPVDVGNILYSLKLFPQGTPHLSSYLTTLKSLVIMLNEPLNSPEIGSSLYGFQNLHNSIPEVEDLFSTLVQKLLNQKVTLSEDAVGSAFYGLRRFHPSNSHNALLVILLEKIKLMPMRDSSRVTNLLYGLQNMESDNNAVVQDLLTVLASKVMNVENAFSTPKWFCSAFIGLMKMNSNCPHVREVIAALAYQLDRSNLYYWSARDISKVMNGLKDMSADHEEVRAFLAAFTRKLRQSTTRKPLTDNYLAFTIFGLRSMDSRVPEVRALLTELVARMPIPERDFTTENDTKSSASLSSLADPNVIPGGPAYVQMSAPKLCLALYSCRGLSDESKEELQLFKVLLSILKRVQIKSGDLTSRDVCMALYGLQSCSAKSGEVRGILEALLPHLKSFGRPFDAQPFGMAMFGLKWMSSDYDVVLRTLAALTARMGTSLDKQSIGNALFGLKTMSGDKPEVGGWGEVEGWVEEAQAMPDLRRVGSPLYACTSMTCLCISGSAFLVPNGSAYLRL